MNDVQAERDELTDAIQLAKAFLLKAFQGEKIENLGLEEVRRDHGSIWDITLGFSRSWDHPTPNNTFLQMAAAAAAARPQRVYKVVKVDLDGAQGLSISNREDD
jgi:hypothetical protein